MTAGVAGVLVEVAFGKTWKDTIEPNGMDLDGTGDLASSPSAAAFQQTGKVEVRGIATSADWTPASEWDVLALWDGGGENQYKVAITTSGEIKFYWSTDGTATSSETSSVALAFAAASTNHIAATIDPATGDVHCYWYAGGWKAPIALADWTELGTVQSSGATTINSGSSVAKIGGSHIGRIHEVELWAGLQADSDSLAANPRFHDIAQWAIGDVASTAVADKQGNTWTLVADAAIIGSWIDLSTDVDLASYKYGRTYELGQHEAGQASTRFINDVRQYEPDYASGAYYPNIKPMVPIRIRIEEDLVSEPKWTGFVNRWKLAYAGNEAYVTASCRDAFNIFNSHQIIDYESAIADDSPLGWWKLGETSGTTATDSGSAGVDGTYVNTPTLNQTGPITNIPGVNFNDSATEEVDIGTLTGSDLTADFSVEFWVNADSGDATAEQALIQIDVDGSDPLAVYYDRAPTTPILGVEAPIASSGSVQATATDLDVSEDNWHHCVLVFSISGKTVVPYVDAVAGATLSLATWDTTRTAGTMSIKIAESTGLTNFDGLISQVAVYASVLTPGQISAHYSAQFGPQSAETYDVRIGNVMTELGWGGGTDLDTGLLTLTAIASVDANVLSVIRRAAKSEGGAVFMGPDGRVRGWSSTTKSDNFTSSQFTFNEIEKAAPQLDSDRVYNIIRVTTIAGTKLVAEDTTSITNYGQRELKVSGVDISDSDATDLAVTLLSQNKDPEQRLESFDFWPDADPTNLWAQIRDRVLGERITLGYQPPGGGAAASLEEHIEALSFRAGRNSLAMVKVQCSKGSLFFILDDAVLGQLDGVGKLG